MNMLNRFKLTFNILDLETRFSQDTYTRTVQQGRIAIFLGVLVYLFYGILDQWLVPADHQSQVWAIRLTALCVPAVVFLLTFTPLFARVSYLSLAMVGLAAGVGFILMLLYVPLENASLYYPGLVLVTFYTYNLLGTRFVYAFVIDMLLLVTYNVVFGWWKGYPLQVMISHDFFIISANLVGGAAGYLQEYQLRLLFVRERELEAERHEHISLSTQLQAALNEIKAIIEANPDILYVINTTGQLIKWNSQLERFSGYSHVEMRHRNFTGFFAEKDRSKAVEWMRHMLEQGSSTIEADCIRHDGVLVPYFFNGELLRDPQGRVSGFTGTGRDITQRKLLDEKLQKSLLVAEAASRATSEFLANMSHEIRTPMSSVLGMVQLLEFETDISAKQRDYLEKIKISGEHLLGVINDILDFSQIEGGKLKIEAIDLNVEQVRQNIISLMGGAAALKGLKLNFTLDPAIPAQLCGDTLRLTQILLNYINNAIKFSERGEISIRAKMIGQGEDSLLLRFEVQDTGIGIAKEKLGKLFQPFQQADNSITRQYGGSGLGLVISKRLAELMGGAVGVESVAGEGSTFWFTAMLSLGKSGMQKTSQTDLEKEKKAVLAALKGAHVLLVDDNNINREVASVYLHRAEVQVTLAQNGKEALELLQQAHYDCVLMDIQMPVMGGLEAMELIRNNPKLAELKVIAMTANASNLDRAHFFAAGMDDFISKPFKPDTLYATIAKCIMEQHPGADFIMRLADAENVASQPDKEKIIDFARLAEFFIDEPNEMRAFMAKAIKSIREDVAKIEAALEHKDMVKVSVLGHHMLTPALMFGVNGFAELCRALEQCKSIEDLKLAQAIVSQLSPMLMNIEETVKDELDNMCA